MLDVSTVIEAARILPAKRSSKRLVQMIMQIALGNAGAEHGLLVLEDNAAVWLPGKSSPRHAPTRFRSRLDAPLGETCGGADATGLGSGDQRYCVRARP